jgi:Zn-dependent protease
MIDWKRGWTFPNTLVGMTTRSIFGRKHFIDRGLGHYEAKPGSPFDRAMRQIGFAAITLGDQVLYVAGGMHKERVLHELEHVAQARRWGPLFFPAYGLASLWSLVRYGSAYRQNRFEQHARDAAGKHTGVS